MPEPICNSKSSELVLGVSKAGGSVVMRTGLAAAILLSVLGVPLVAFSQAMPAGFAVVGQPTPINPLDSARSHPLPSDLEYLRTIKFIDDGMRYVDPLSAFFISPIGEMCFRMRPNYPQIMYEAFHRDWCIHPQMVDRVEPAPDDAAMSNEVRVWCKRSNPQCAHSLGEFGTIANSISAATAGRRQESAALVNLIHLMGGNVRSPQPVSFQASGSLQ